MQRGYSRGTPPVGGCIKGCKLFIALILVLLLASCSGRSGGRGIILAGSTSVQPYAEVLVEDFALLFPGSRIDIQGGGSSAGITAAKSGTADIGMSSRSLTEAESDLWSVEIAIDGLAIIVNPANGIQNLSIDQVKRIYTAEITDWSELGGAKASIHVFTREEGSGTRSAFESLVMGDERITPKAMVQDSNGAVRQLVGSDSYAIGFVSLGLADETVKAISLDGVTASHDNVVSGEYSLYRSFLFVANEKPQGLSLDFINFVLSDEGQKILLNEGLIPPIRGEDS